MPLYWRGEQWFRQIVLPAADDTLGELADGTVNEAKQHAPRASGHLRRAIARTRPMTTRGLRLVRIGIAGGSAAVFRYMMAVEHGRRPGKPPPYEELIPWVRIRKLDAIAMSVKANKHGRRSYRYGKKPDREKRQRSIAFLIARHIGRFGTKAQPFLIPAFDRHKVLVARVFRTKLHKRVLDARARHING